MSDPASGEKEPTVREQFTAALTLYQKARVAELHRTGLDTAATAVNLSTFGLQFEALVSCLLDNGVLTRDQFQTKAAERAVQMAEQMSKPQIQMARPN